MVTIIRSSLIVLIALLPGLLVSGQVKFTTIADRQEIGRGEYLQVEFVVENAKQIDQLNPPDFPGFHVVQGPIQSSGMSIVNGNMSQYKALSFILQPVKTGKFTIGGAGAVVDGKPMRSNSITVTVNASAGNGSSGNSGGNNPSSGGVNPNTIFPQMNWPDPPGGDPTDIDREYMLRPGDNIKEKIRKNLFVKVQVDKTSCYVGEPIVATYKLYSRLSSESRVTKRPSLNGFSVYDMVDPSSDASSIEKVNGRPFTVHIIRKTQLIPLQAGTIDLDPVEVENTVHFVKGSRQDHAGGGNSLRDLFDRMSDDNATGPELEENVVLDTKPLAITIKPLPEENKPADYNGAVGNFSILASLSNNKNISVRDDATLKVVVKGGGNLPIINAPSVTWPSGIEAYEPTAKEDLNKTTVPMSGSKSFEYVFSPRVAGRYTIPSIPFSYFDPASHTYKKVQSAPIDFQVDAAVKKNGTSARLAPAPATVAPSSGVKNFIQQHLESLFAILILSGLAYYLLRQNLRLRTAEKQQQAAAAVQAVTAKHPTPSREGALAREEKGYYSRPVIAADPLQDSRLLLANGDYKGFYRELNRAVWKAVSEKLNLPSSELNKYNMAKQLQARGWDADTTRSLDNLLNECEMNLYTPAYDPYNMQQLLRQAETLFSVLITNSSY
ncbi:MAG TPA: BatD family protein [Puia sp.]|nr:BatD family protein [Puia sp.]